MKEHTKKHISYSELMDHRKCEMYHYLKHIEELQGFKGNEYTEYGTAIHETVQEMIVEEAKNRKGEYWLDPKWQSSFEVKFSTLIREFMTANPEYVIKKDLVLQMVEQTKKILPLIIPSMYSSFGNYSVVGIENELYESINAEINGKTFSFKGFIDLVILDEAGTHHIIDFKTCSWGWEPKVLNSVEKTYQLTYYKKFYSQKFGVPEEKIKTHFALLKRTAKKGNVEIIEVAVGKKKIENATKFLVESLELITSGSKKKNKFSCSTKYGACEFFGNSCTGC